MACLKPETFLTEEEIKVYLEALMDQSLKDTELSKTVKHPLFKVRSILRELERLGYVALEEELIKVTEKGQNYYREASLSPS